MWRHADPNMSDSATAGLAAMAAADWSGNERALVRDFQAVLALKLMLVAELCGSVSFEPTGEAIVSADVIAATGDRADAARALLAPISVYALGAKLGPVPAGDIVTAAPQDTGALPVIIVAIVAGAALAGWVAHEASGVIKYFKTANDQRDTMQKADAAATAMLAKHIEAEQVAGKAIELSAAEREQLAILKQRADEMSKALASQNEKPAAPVPWYVWAGVGAAGVAALAYLVSRPGKATLLALPSTAKAA